MSYFSKKNPETIIEKIILSFLNCRPVKILIGGSIIAFVELLFLLGASHLDGTWYIENGVGLSEHYAIYTFLVGDIALLYLLRLYIDSTLSVKENLESKEQQSIIDKHIDSFITELSLKDRHKFIYIGLLIFAFIFWTSNYLHHLNGNTVQQWGKLTFDAYQFKFGFYLTRVHLFVSWVLMIPFLAFTIILVTKALTSILIEISGKHGLPFDLLHSDKCGGYSFIGKTFVYLNLIFSVFYVQVSSVVFLSQETTNEQIAIYIILTISLFFGNSMILNGSFNLIDNARKSELEIYKNGLTSENNLFNFDIYKYCLNEVKSNPFDQYSKNLILSTKIFSFFISIALQADKISKIIPI